MGSYAPRAADGAVLHGVVRDHLEEFLATAAARTDGVGLPAFVEREFRGFLRCGLLVHGFTRVRCDTCAYERLVPFSCKTRAVCSSCGGRRMAERAAHLVEAVLPAVPVRQWVLTVPHRLRYRLAFDHALCHAVVGVFVRAVLGDYRRRARRRGLPDGQGGCVTVIQRFGSGLQLTCVLRGSHPPVAQSGVLAGLRVRLIYGLFRTKKIADLRAPGRPAVYRVRVSSAAGPGAARMGG